MNGDGVGGDGSDGGGVHEYSFIICFIPMKGKNAVLLLRLDRKNPMNTYQMCFYVLRNIWCVPYDLIASKFIQPFAVLPYLDLY